MSVDGANEIADTISFFLWFLMTGYPVPLIIIVGGLKVFQGSGGSKGRFQAVAAAVAQQAAQRQPRHGRK